MIKAPFGALMVLPDFVCIEDRRWPDEIFQHAILDLEVIDGARRALRTLHCIVNLAACDQDTTYARAYQFVLRALVFTPSVSKSLATP